VIEDKKEIEILIKSHKKNKIPFTKKTATDYLIILNKIQE
jgi:hypothetical protein